MSDEHTNHRKRTKLIVIILLNIFLAFAAGYGVATVRGVEKVLFDKNGEVDITKVTDLYQRTRADSVSFDQFWQVWNQVKAKYVHQPADEVKMFYGAMEGMVAGLGDPYSVYFPPQKAEEFTAEISGQFEGIGAELGKKEEQLVVIAPIPKSPAEAAGLKSGDRIFAINGEPTAGLSVDAAASKIRGQKGTIVTLTIAPENKDVLNDIKITRDVIVVPTVLSEVKPNNIAYVRLAVFNKETWPNFNRTIDDLLKKSPKGLILDLRSNPGGYLETAVQVASEWVESGPIVRERFSSGPAQEHSTTGMHRLKDIRTVVLVDGGTASASEIVAGALQDYKKATVVGEKTFGKGSVQSFDILPDGSALKITIATWFTPNDRQINDVGIEPDVIIAPPASTSTSSPKPGTDPALDKALEILSGRGIN